MKKLSNDDLLRLVKIITKANKFLMSYSNNPEWFGKRFFNHSALSIVDMTNYGASLRNELFSIEYSIDIKTWKKKSTNNQDLIEVNVALQTRYLSTHRTISARAGDLGPHLTDLLEQERESYLLNTLDTKAWKNINAEDLNKIIIPRIKNIKNQQREYLKQGNLEIVAVGDRLINEFREKINKVKDPNLKTLLKLVNLLET